MINGTQARAAGLALLVTGCSAGVAGEAVTAARTDESFTTEDIEQAQRLGLAEGTTLPTGARITPEATPGARRMALNPGLATRPDYTVDHPSSVLASGDGKTLLVITSGYNRSNGPDGETVAAESTEWLFVLDATTSPPTLKQALPVNNTFFGMVLAPTGDELYVSGGVDDAVYVFRRSAQGVWAADGSIALGHAAGLGLEMAPAAAGIAITADGAKLVVANYENDSISVVDRASRAVVAELDLRPGKQPGAVPGTPGGEYPFWVTVVGSRKAYVGSQRDGEVVVVDLSTTAPVISGRIPVGLQPAKMILDARQERLFVANASSDTVSVIDTTQDAVTATLPVAAPSLLLPSQRRFQGANPNALALSPDEKTLYVTNGGINAVSIVRLRDRGQGGVVVGSIPTGWYPNAVAVVDDGNRLVVLDAKGPSGANPKGCRANLSTDPAASAACSAANQYNWQMEKGDLLSVPVPRGLERVRQSLQTARNNRFPGFAPPSDAERMMAFLRRRIRHIVYVIKENRTYDQVLGDLEVGDGDPSLAIFPDATAPNHHALARDFVTLDRFFDSGESSGVGWNWSTSGRTTDAVEKTQPVNYAGRGFAYDWEGTNRNVNVGYATASDRRAANPFTPADPDLLPGTRDVSAAPGPSTEEGAGYLWDAALRKGLEVRNYGFFGDLTRYFLPPTDPAAIPPVRDPRALGLRVFYPTKESLQTTSDPYFRGYDTTFPDTYRVEEWEREFDAYVAKGELPALELVRLPMDHFGSFGRALAGVNTPERQMADNDYAVGRLVEKISRSRFADDTLVAIIEDDCQDGPDHVESHRSIALFAGPYVKQGAVVSTTYTTVNLVRTIGSILGLEPLGLTDALAEPMADVFTTGPRTPWPFDARVPGALRDTSLPLPAPREREPRASSPRHDAAYWDAVTEGQRFEVEDALDADRFQRALWEGMAPGAPFPQVRHGRDLSANRSSLLRGLGPTR